MASQELETRELELKEAQLKHAVEQLAFNKETFEHTSKLDKFQTLMAAREFAFTAKKHAWGEKLQTQLEKLTDEIYPTSKLVL